MSKPVYVLGTGLSHDGSACLLKDGRFHVAIEKERITRQKHDGGNDAAAIAYCLDAAKITLADLTLVVQNSNFGDFERGNSEFGGPRPFGSGCPVPVVTISHHLAHAYSALGMCPFTECSILVVDGCGNSADECKGPDAEVGLAIADDDTRHLYFEKDSYYSYRDGRLQVVLKDFSPWGLALKGCPMTPNTTKHSIGGIYEAASSYCLRGSSDLGKLMGLAPYGRAGAVHGEIFELRDGRVFVRYDWMKGFNRPARSEDDLRRNFQHYADIAWWVQREVERALVYLVDSRYRMAPSPYLAYAGGVALNAVANAVIRRRCPFNELFIVPAAGDNGISIGCAFYGWLAVLQRERILHDGSTCFGRIYSRSAVGRAAAAAAGASHAAAERQLPPGSTILSLVRLVHGCFRAGSAAGWSGSLCWKTPGFKPLTTVIDRHGCHVVEDALPGPSSVVTGSPSAIAAFFLGNLDPAQALATGSLECTNADGLMTFYKSIDWDAVQAVVRQGPAALGWLRESALVVRQDGNAIRGAANLLAAGRVIAWFQDGAEFGPRALGRRSILADPRLPDLRDVINREIKRREDFRPFAPSVLRSEAQRFFACDFDSPYMILVAQVRPAWAERLRSVVHRDGSARLQTVTRGWNHKYHRLLSEFRQLTGISVLLNTSLNRRGMPIVETPEEALNFFRETPRLDALVIDRFIVTRDTAGERTETAAADPSTDTDRASHLYERTGRPPRVMAAAKE